MPNNPRFMYAAQLIVAATVTILGASPGFPQEVAAIDVTQNAAADKPLRRPDARSDETGLVRGGTAEIHECRASRDTISPLATQHATQTQPTLQTTLVSLDRAEYRVGDNITFEVRVKNVGTAPMSLPFSPYLADVQAAAAGETFRYYELVVKLWIGGLRWSADTAGTLSLYGATDHPGTMVKLQPGEWVKIAGQSTVSLSDLGMQLIRTGDIVRQANARVSLYENQTLLTASATATVSNGICLKDSHGQSVSVKVAGP